MKTLFRYGQYPKIITGINIAALSKTGFGAVSDVSADFEELTFADYVYAAFLFDAAKELSCQTDTIAHAGVGKRCLLNCYFGTEAFFTFEMTPISWNYSALFPAIPNSVKGKFAGFYTTMPVVVGTFKNITLELSNNDADLISSFDSIAGGRLYAWR